MSVVLSLISGPDDEGRRIDAFIGYNVDELSRSFAVRLIEKGNVTVNDKTVTSKKHRLAANDRITIEIPEPEASDIIAEDIPLDIVYEDADVIVVNKPKGMVVHPGPGNRTGTLVNAVMYHCGDSLSSINGVMRPGIVHRIDKNTSGLIMIAKNDRTHISLAEQLKLHTVTREYTALVFDNIREDTLTIDAPIGRDERNRMRRAVYGSGQKEAITHICVAERFGNCTLIKARLETGRTHQIRVHMAYRKHPLIGDELYGPRSSQGRSDNFIGVRLDGQLLHAGRLGFIHPTTGEYLEFTSDLPENFSEVLVRLRTVKNGKNP